jgi:hypothetical protein
VLFREDSAMTPITSMFALRSAAAGHSVHGSPCLAQKSAFSSPPLKIRCF